MANVHGVQILGDGHRNFVIKVVGALDTSNFALATIADPALVSPIATGFRIDRIQYSIADQLAVQLLWDATVDDVAINLTGRGEFSAREYGGLLNPKSVGWNGKLLMQTTGWASGIQDYTLLIHLVKMGVTA